MPRPTGFVVKNGSKMDARVASSIPVPVSVTVSVTYDPGGISSGCSGSLVAWSVTFAVAISSDPPCGIASRPFTTGSPFLHRLHRERLLDDTACCALLTPDHPLAARSEIALAELAELPFLFMPRSLYPAFYDRVMTYFAAQDFLPRIEQPYEGLQTTWSLARRGGGWCIGFRTNLRYPPAGLAAVSVRDLDLPLGIDMLHRRDETRGVVLGVMDLIRRAAEEEMATWVANPRPPRRGRSHRARSAAAARPGRTANAMVSDLGPVAAARDGRQNPSGTDRTG